MLENMENDNFLLRLIFSNQATFYFSETDTIYVYRVYKTPMKYCKIKETHRKLTILYLNANKYLWTILYFLVKHRYWENVPGHARKL